MKLKNRYILKISKTLTDSGLQRYELWQNDLLIESGENKQSEILNKFMWHSPVISFVQNIKKTK